MRQLIKNFRQSDKGNTTVEFALVIPIFMLLLSGIFEVTMYAFLHNKASRIAGTMSHIISLQNISRPKLMAIIATAEKIAEPFTFTGRGGVIVSQIHNDGETTNPANMIIGWQDGSNLFTSRIGAPDGAPANLPDNVSVVDDQALIVTEVFYNYQPFIFRGLINNQLIYKTAVYVPRLGDMNTLIDE